MKRLALLTSTLALATAPAFALPSQVPSNQGTSNAGNQGTTHRPATPNANSPTPSSNRALGVQCANESKSNTNDPQPGTPFSRCVRELAQAIRTACQGQSKSNENDPEPGTPYSRCVRNLARSLGNSSNPTSTTTTARRACSKGDFATARLFSRCVRVLNRELSQHQS